MKKKELQSIDYIKERADENFVANIFVSGINLYFVKNKIIYILTDFIMMNSLNLISWNLLAAYT